MRARLRHDPSNSFVEDVIEIEGIALESKAGLARSTQWAHASSHFHLQLIDDWEREFLVPLPSPFQLELLQSWQKA